MDRAYIHSELGYWILESNGEKLHSISFSKTKPSFDEAEDPLLAEAKKQLTEYFNGTRTSFSIPLNTQEHSIFYQKVWNVLQKIPYGKTCSYSDIATELGDINAVRAVGMANGRNPFPIVIPCHRVIGKNKELTGYAYGIDLKRKLLEKEGALAIQGSLF